MYKLVDNLKIRKRTDKTVLVFDPLSDYFHEFNQTAGDLFLSISAGDSKKQTLAKLSKQYNIEPKDIEKDYDSFVKKLLKTKIITKND